MRLGIGLAINQSTSLGGGGSSGPPVTSNLVADWRFNEGSGLFVANRANGALRETSNNLLFNPENSFKSNVAGNMWTNNVLTVTDNVDVSANPPLPGVTLASSFVGGAGNNFCQYTNGLSLAAGTYTLSCYFKSNNGANQNVRLGYTAGSDSYGSNISVTNAAGWVRASRTFTAAAPVTAVFLMGDGTSACNLLVWGAKLEAGSGSAYATTQGDLTLSPSSGPPVWSSPGVSFTTTVAAQRAQGTFPGAGLNLSQVSVYAAFKQTAAAPDYCPLLCQPGITSRLELESVFNTNQAPRGCFGTQNLVASQPVATGHWHVFGMTCDGSRLRLYVDGNEVADAAYTGSGSGAIGRLLVGDINGVGPMGGTMGYAALYSTGHTAAQARQMSAYIAATVAARGVTVTSPANYTAWEGDSITFGAGLSSIQNYAYLSQTLLAPTTGRNFSVNASTVITATERAATVDAMLWSGMTSSVLSVFLGANDLVSGGSLPNYLTNLQAYVTARKAAGWRKVAVCTLLARAASLGGAANIDETVRGNANTAIRAGQGVWHDGTIDIAADPVMGIFGYTADATNCQDGCHPTAAGQIRLRDIVTPRITTILAQP